MEIPDKIFFKIGEVSDIAGVKPYVLRYWETEFSIVPQKSKSGQRLYRRKDIERILLIKRLLYQEGFTIVGARKYLVKLPKVAVKSLLEGGPLVPDGAHKEAAKATTKSVKAKVGKKPASSKEVSKVDKVWLDSLRIELGAIQGLIAETRDFQF